MKVEYVNFIVEEPSMHAALELLIPKISPGLMFEVHAHQGKSDLLKRLPERLKGYKAWLPPTWRVVVVVDRDDDDCEKLKAELEEMAAQAGLLTPSKATGHRFQVANRIAVEELEAWYFGDWDAVRAAYPRVAPSVPAKAKFRDPDSIAGGTCEAFERILQDAGYMGGGLTKIDAARAVSARMDPARNRSPSFRALRDLLQGL